MQRRDGLVRLPDSEPSPFLGARVYPEEIDLNQRIQITVVVRPRTSETKKLSPQNLERFSRQLPRSRRYLDSTEIQKLHRAAPAHIARVVRFAEEHRLEVVETGVFGCCVVLNGTLGALASAFHIKFRNLLDLDGSVYRSHKGFLMLPARLAEVIEGILGLDNHPAARRPRPHHQKPRQQQPTKTSDVATAYDFPADADGTGQCIGIIELGGGFHQSDIDDYFSDHQLPRRKIGVVQLSGQRNSPADHKALGMAVKRILHPRLATAPSNSRQTFSPQVQSQCMWTIETTLDIDVAASFAPGAKIVVYMAPNSSQGKYWALMTALTDRKHNPSVLSCSWGTFEEDISPMTRALLHRVFQSAVLRGVTICSSSGDLGDGSILDGKPHVHASASNPYVLACGGAHLTLSA